ncbi:hypothetical protein GGX14DRAFT_476583 [Mycena pura]|uniref:Uncharacterized protein n=1 Tax=Mycena pura TaxID=153505 RepID=A0AAD6V0A0_9AGAR|nr:hypothetical protein GGX14DRAFT_476583 [Mycena pura]
MTTISSSSATPIDYAHPYIICHDTSSKALSVWTCTGEPQLHATLEGEASSTARSYVAAPDRIVTQSIDGTASTILVHSLPDGQLLNAHALGSGAVYISRKGLIAKWDDERAKSHVYGLTENGKLARLGDLSSPVEEALDSPSGSDIPQGVYLTAEAFVHSQVRYPDPTVHLTCLSSTPPRRASFGLTRAPPDDIPGVVMNSMLVDAIPISSSSSPSFVMAHVEQVLGFNEDNPKTALRSIDPQTLALGWCTLIDQQTEWLRYSAATNVVVAYGWMGVEQGTGIIVLDATTGTVLRAEPIGKPKEKCGALSGSGVYCDLTPAGDTLVVVFGDGQLAVAPLVTFAANGFVREGDSGLLVTIPCPEFALATPTNSKERRSKVNGSWAWIKRAFVADGVVVVVPNKGSDFAVLRW